MTRRAEAESGRVTRVLTRGVAVVLSLWALATFILAGCFFFDAWQRQLSPDAPVPIRAGSIRYLTVPERLFSLIVLTLGIVFIVQCLTSVRRGAARASAWLVPWLALSWRSLSVSSLSRALKRSG
jgi:hypothetical protein